MNCRHRRIGKGLACHHRTEQHGTARLDIVTLLDRSGDIAGHQTQSLAGKHI